MDIPGLPAIVVGACTAFGSLIALRHRMIRISQDRSRRLWTIARKSPTSAEPLALQLACAPVFGPLAPRDIRFGLTRENPLQFLKNRQRAGKLVHLRDDEAGFEDARTRLWKWIPFADASNGVFYAALPAFFILLFYTFLAQAEGLFVQGLGLIDAIALPALLCAASVRLDAAARLLTGGEVTRVAVAAVVSKVSASERRKKPSKQKQVAGKSNGLSHQDLPLNQS